MLDYPILIEKDEDSLLVTCPDLPEVTSYGDDVKDALVNGADAVEEALAGRLDAFEDIPRPSEGAHTVSVSSLIGLKVLLFWEISEQGVSRAELMRRLGWPRNQVDRLFKPRHGTKLDQFDAAFAAMGRKLVAKAA